MGICKVDSNLIPTVFPSLILSLEKKNKLSWQTDWIKAQTKRKATLLLETRRNHYQNWSWRMQRKSVAFEVSKHRRGGMTGPVNCERQDLLLTPQRLNVSTVSRRKPERWKVNQLSTAPMACHTHRLTDITYHCRTWKVFRFLTLGLLSPL